VCDLETSRMGAPYIYDISHLRVNAFTAGGETPLQSPWVCRNITFRLSSQQHHIAFRVGVEAKRSVMLIRAALPYFTVCTVISGATDNLLL